MKTGLHNLIKESNELYARPRMIVSNVHHLDDTDSIIFEHAIMPTDFADVSEEKIHRSTA